MKYIEIKKERIDVLYLIPLSFILFFGFFFGVVAYQNNEPFAKIIFCFFVMGFGFFLYPLLNNKDVYYEKIPVKEEKKNV